MIGPHQNRGPGMERCVWHLPADSSTWTAADALHSAAGAISRADDLSHYSDANRASSELVRVSYLPNLRRLLEDTEQQVVEEARAAGHTWHEIGTALGTPWGSAVARYGETAK